MFTNLAKSTPVVKGMRKE